MRAKTIQYRKCQMKDSKDMRNLLEKALGYSVSEEAFAGKLQKMLSSGQYHLFVACEGEQVVGFVGAVSYLVFEMEKEAAKIIALAVSESHRKKGIGSDLLYMAEVSCRDHGIGILLLNSGLAREEAHGFYEAKGYTKKSFGFVKILN